GRLSYATAQSGGDTRFEASLKGERLDLDAAAAMARSFTGPSGAWPDQASVSLDLGRAVWKGQELKPLAAKLAYDPQTIAVDQLKFGQGAGVVTEGTLKFDRGEATGRVALATSAPSLKEVAALLQPVAPTLVARLDAAAPAPGPARL